MPLNTWYSFRWFAKQLFPSFFHSLSSQKPSLYHVFNPFVTSQPCVCICRGRSQNPAAPKPRWAYSSSVGTSEEMGCWYQSYHCQKHTKPVGDSAAVLTWCCFTVWWLLCLFLFAVHVQMAWVLFLNHKLSCSAPNCSFTILFCKQARSPTGVNQRSSSEVSGVMLTYTVGCSGPISEAHLLLSCWRVTKMKLTHLCLPLGHCRFSRVSLQ